MSSSMSSTTQDNTTDLIVDFPSQSQSCTTSHKTLRFSNYALLFMIEVPPVEPSQISYTREDKILSKQQLVNDVYHARQMMHDVTQKQGRAIIIQDNVCAFIGLEPLLMDSGKEVANQRDLHAKKIILNQDRLTPDELSQISMQSSKQTREQSFKLASIYASFGSA